jgi:hypothetical protein
MPKAPEHVISPQLFDSVGEYVVLLRSGGAFSEKNVIPETSPIISFTENAFKQFFGNEVGSEITGFDEQFKKRAARARYRKRGGLSKQALEIIVLFEQFCDIHEDVIAGGYGGASAVLEEFHTIYVSRLLERIRALAGAKNDGKLRERADAALTEYGDALETVTWPKR